MRSLLTTFIANPHALSICILYHHFHLEKVSG